MPDFWMDVDAALAEVPVNLFPLIDDTDFKTRETAVAFNAAGMDLVWNFVTTAGAMTQTAVTPTSGGDYDWTHQGDGMYSIEIPASGGASINNDTEGFGWFTGLATGVLPWRGPTIGFRAAALNNALIDGGAILDVNAAQISGDATAADNLETMLDGTGGQVLSLKQLNIVNSTGTALIAQSTGNNGAGALFKGHGSSEGLDVDGGTSGHAATFTPGASSGDGIQITSPTAIALYINGTAGDIVGDITGNLSGSVGSVTGLTAATVHSDLDDIQAKIGTPSNLGSGATVAANLVDIEAQTDDIGIAGAGLTNIPAGAINPDVLITTTITNLVSQTLWDLTAGSADDNAYNGCRFIVTDASTAVQKCVGVVNIYSGATKTMSPKDDPGIFTIANGDTISIMADRSLKPTVDNRTLDITTGGAAGLDWGNMENKTTTNALTGTTVDLVADAVDSSSLAASAVDEILDDGLADSVPADGSLPTVRQALYMLVQFLYERSVSGTTVTVKKVDGTTSLLTLTLNDATTPTSITRAT